MERGASRRFGSIKPVLNPKRRRPPHSKIPVLASELTHQDLCRDMQAARFRYTADRHAACMSHALHLAREEGSFGYGLIGPMRPKFSVRRSLFLNSWRVSLVPYTDGLVPRPRNVKKVSESNKAQLHHYHVSFFFVRNPNPARLRTNQQSNMKNILVTAILALVFISTASAKSLVNVDKNGVGIKGHDPVAYFTDNRAVKGNAQFQSNFNGVTYYFASAENKAAFDAKPTKYEPQFGGFCAWAVSRGYTASIDPNAFQIVNGRLLLQYSLGVRKDFSADTEGNLKKADANWPSIVEKKGK